MIFVLLALAGLAWWLHSRGELRPALRRWGAVAALVVLAAVMFKTGRPVFGAVVAGAALMWGYAGMRRVREVGSEREALKLLGLSGEPGPAEIHAAWRRALASAHPDAGGSASATQRATAARDLLLERLAARDTED